MKYKTTAKLVIQACDKDLPGVFGHGCVLLLQGIAREHSLNRAAKSMGMAYSKAWRIVNEAEGQLGCKLIERDGARGSTLTPAGERAIAVYEELQDIKLFWGQVKILSVQKSFSSPTIDFQAEFSDLDQSGLPGIGA